MIQIFSASGYIKSFMQQSQAANMVFAGPLSGSAAPSFRALVASDLASALAAPPTIGATAPATVYASSLIVSLAAGNARSIALLSGSSNRWLMKADAIAESGSNAGSNWVLESYDDAGVFLRTVATALRNTGEFRIYNNLGHLGPAVGFFGSTPVSKPTVTGSKGGNAALSSLCSALASLGLITNSTS
jgi:hypothetical protein